MSLVRSLLVAGLLALAAPVLAGGAFHAGVGFHGGGFPGGGFHGGGFHGGFGFRGGHIGFGFRGHREFFGVHGFFGALNPGFGKGRLGDRYPAYGYGYAYPGNYGSGYSRYGWRKWWTYTDFSQINYPGVYPASANQNPPRRDDLSQY